MPASLTHYEFYKKATNNIDVGTLGAQGPDPFFFYGNDISMTIKARGLRAYGTFLHKADPAVSFKYLMEYILGSDEKEQEILYTFTKGLLAHYVLDKTCHPYIWYKSGFVTKNDKSNFKYFAQHANIESTIDVLIMDHFKDETTTFEALKYNKKELKIVSKMMYSLGKGCYKNKYITEDSYYKAIKSMKFVSRALYSKTGKKKAFFDKFLGKTPLSPMSEPKLKDIKFDVLNLKHITWRDCVTNKNPRKDDFYKLFDNALVEYKKDLSFFDAIMNKTKKPSSLMTLFKGIDHNGFPLNSTKIYSDSFYK